MMVDEKNWTDFVPDITSAIKQAWRALEHWDINNGLSQTHDHDLTPASVI